MMDATPIFQSRFLKMSEHTVECTVKRPVALQMGDVKTDMSRPGIFVIDVTFPQGQTVNIQEISFKNYYTAFLTVRLQRQDPESPENALKWITGLKDCCLMPNPHTERGSQDYFSIYRQQMLIEPDDVTSVRLILRQPSSSWLTFTLEEIKIFECVNEDSKNNFPSWFSNLSPVDQSPDLQEGIPDPKKVSSSIQQMWALTEVMQTNQTAARIGRFDVDGCYEINLLSYT
nr:PREDICTED: nicolin-1 [Lepisosteus oculatus]